MRKKSHIIVLIMILSLLAAGSIYLATSTSSPSVIAPLAPFNYIFQGTSTLNESGAMDESTSPYWWVNSGGKLILDSGRGETIQGSLPITDKWYKLYAAANPLDTDGGLHPQNIFRLVTKGVWHNAQQEAYFKINADNLSASPNRNASNGLLLFNRYADSQNLYYTGVRVDGTAVIKKKIDGKYYTMAQKKLFPGTYDTATNPNLLPKGRWIGLRSTVTTGADGIVTVSLYTDINWNAKWTLVLQATDDGSKYGPINDTTSSGGIRTDFMDVTIDNYKAREI